jgi:hypothetical protein
MSISIIVIIIIVVVMDDHGSYTTADVVTHCMKHTINCLYCHHTPCICF